ncbi:MAG TPA: type II toxin-antitoxin system prevent-host-death family antitoxin [Vicinamibacteria bacterium]|nr:type II toxin-antitoxin system prevent-host-death family antitoxin [Vicinamibacteria bacterium]
MLGPKRREVGARELKTRLGTYLREVRAGATLIITERGEPVAEIRPLPTGGTSEKARLDELVARGSLTRESRKKLASFRAIRMTGRPLSVTIIEDREDRF